MWLFCFFVTPCLFCGVVLFCSSLLGIQLFGLAPEALMWSTLCVALYTIAEAAIWGAMVLCSRIEGFPLDLSPWGICKKAVLSLLTPIMLFVMGTGVGNMLLALFDHPLTPPADYFFSACVAAVLTFLILMGCIYMIYHTLHFMELRRKALQELDNLPKKEA